MLLAISPSCLGKFTPPIRRDPVCIRLWTGAPQQWYTINKRVSIWLTNLLLFFLPPPNAVCKANSPDGR